MSVTWFGPSAPLWWLWWPWKLSKRVPVRLWTIYRRTGPLNSWGVGLLFVESAHLVYVGSAGVTLGFRRVWQPERERMPF